VAQEPIKTQKGLSERDGNQVFQSAHNDVNSSIAVDGFLVGKVGRKIDMQIQTTNSANDTELYTFSENGTDLYSIKVIYTDGTRDILLSAERVS